MIMSVPDEGYSKNATCALNSTSTLFSLAYCGSLIDHILCNTSEKISKSGVIEVRIGDHFISFLYIKVKTTKKHTGKQSMVRIRTEALLKNDFKEKSDILTGRNSLSLSAENYLIQF